MNYLTVAEREELGLPVDYAAESAALDRKIKQHDRDIAAILETTPCGCYACDEGVQQGHFACEMPPDWALERERAGKITRRLDGSAWRWVDTSA